MGKLFKIGQVADLLGVNTSAIRFWETKFNVCDASRMSGRHRYYSEAEVKILQKICQMLKEERYTITGAKSALKQGVSSKTNDNNRFVLQEKTHIMNALNKLQNLQDYVKMVQIQIDNWKSTD